MFWVVVTAPNYNVVFSPNDLSADGEAGGNEALGHHVGFAPGVPDIGHVAREQRPGFAPVGPVVVAHQPGGMDAN